MPTTAWGALGIVAMAVLAVARGFEVRTTLLGAALLIGALAGELPTVTQTFFATFAAERFVLPICSAMGFAFTLRETGCDRALVRLLLTPLKRGGFALVPGVVLAGVVVNVPVISQASAAVCLGAVAVPLLRAARLSPAAVGSTLILGVSIGGELLNPGAPELASIRDQVGGTTAELVPRLFPVVLTMVLVAVPAFTLLTVRAERRLRLSESHEAEPVAELEAPFTSADLVRALVPVVPLSLLFLLGPPGNVVPVPAAWLVPAGDAADARIGARLVALAMLAGVLAAALARPGKARDCLPAFFQGAGHGFATIVSLIITATTFGKAVELAGLGAALGQVLIEQPWLIWPAAVAVPYGFALVSGSGMASTQSLVQSFMAPALAAGLDPAEVGAVVATAAAGRTMSPVAAVVLSCAALSGSTPAACIRRMTGPLLLGLIAVAASKAIWNA